MSCSSNIGAFFAVGLRKKRLTSVQQICCAWPGMQRKPNSLNPNGVKFSFLPTRPRPTLPLSAYNAPLTKLNHLPQHNPSTIPPTPMASPGAMGPCIEPTKQNACKKQVFLSVEAHRLQSADIGDLLPKLFFVGPAALPKENKCGPCMVSKNKVLAPPPGSYYSRYRQQRSFRCHICRCRFSSRP
jgi:hypothetical protein